LSNTGAVVIAAGSALSDAQILGMNFLVQGVQGSLPK
jgi:simple sugar transport system substrate-binding protein